MHTCNLKDASCSTEWYRFSAFGLDIPLILRFCDVSKTQSAFKTRNDNRVSHLLQVGFITNWHTDMQSPSIMGPTGSGKSTVCPDHFLNYFWDIYHTYIVRRHCYPARWPFSWPWDEVLYVRYSHYPNETPYHWRSCDLRWHPWLRRYI